MNTFNYFFWSIMSCIAGLVALFYGLLGINDIREADVLYEADHGIPPESPLISRGKPVIYGICIAAGIAMQFIPLLF